MRVSYIKEVLAPVSKRFAIAVPIWLGIELLCIWFGDLRY